MVRDPYTILFLNCFWPNPKLPFSPPYIDEGLLGHVLMDAGDSGPGVGGHVAPMSDPLAAAHAGRQPLLRIKLRWEVHGVSPAAQR